MKQKGNYRKFSSLSFTRFVKFTLRYQSRGVKANKIIPFILFLPSTQKAPEEWQLFLFSLLWYVICLRLLNGCLYFFGFTYRCV